MDKQTKKKLQKEYCREQRLPLFAIFDNCPDCGNDFWHFINENEAKTKLITGCTICANSFCD